MATSRPEWSFGFVDEVWFSRLAQPHLAAWSLGTEPLRLFAKSLPKEDKTAKALACYGLYMPEAEQQPEQMWLRFVEGRPVSSLTCAFLQWIVEQVAASSRRIVILFWDNASWHISHEVKAWLKAHKRAAKSTCGVRLLICPLPTQSPWLNRIEAKWVHGKRAVVEPERVLSAPELAQRLCGYYGCEYLEYLKQ
jgi:hypothetical protein